MSSDDMHFLWHLAKASLVLALMFLTAHFILRNREGCVESDFCEAAGFLWKLCGCISAFSWAALWLISWW